MSNWARAYRLAFVLLAAGLSIAMPIVAAASPPVCFPERTVMWSARLYDEQDRVFGGVRAGQVVHVLDERPGPDGSTALVEVREPVRVRGIVERKPLLVFARHDIDRKAALVELQVSATSFRERTRRLRELSESILRLSRVSVVSGYVGQDAAGRCREHSLSADGAQVRVRDDCSFGLEWDGAHPLSIRGDEDYSRFVELSPLYGRSASANCRRGPAERPEGLRCHVSGDVLDVCLNGPCSNVSGRAHLYARVLASAHALAADARVAAFGADGRMLDSCHAPSGACFLHELPAGTPVVLQASARGVTATTSFVTTAGVTERDILLGARPERTGERSADQTPMRSSSIKGAVSGRSRSRSTMH